MKEYLTISYQDVQILFEISEKHWTVNLTQIANKFNKSVEKIIFDYETVEKLKLADSIIDCPIMKTKRKGAVNLQGTWIHFLAASYMAAQIDPDFDLWLLARYDEILNQYSEKYHLEADEPEQIVLSMLTEIKPNEDPPEFLTNPLNQTEVQDPNFEDTIHFGNNSEHGLLDERTYSTKEIASSLGTTPIEFLLTLNEKGYIYRKKGQWILSKEFWNMGLVTTKKVTSKPPPPKVVALKKQPSKRG